MIHVADQLRFRDIPEDRRARIERAPDLATLDRWLDLAFTAHDLDAFRRAL